MPNDIDPSQPEGDPQNFIGRYAELPTAQTLADVGLDVIASKQVELTEAEWKLTEAGLTLNEAQHNYQKAESAVEGTVKALKDQKNHSIDNILGRIDLDPSREVVLAYALIEEVDRDEAERIATQIEDIEGSGMPYAIIQNQEDGSVKLSFGQFDDGEGSVLSHEDSADHSLYIELPGAEFSAEASLEADGIYQNRDPKDKELFLLDPHDPNIVTTEEDYEIVIDEGKRLGVYDFGRGSGEFIGDTLVVGEELVKKILTTMANHNKSISIADEASMRQLGALALTEVFGVVNPDIRLGDQGINKNTEFADAYKQRLSEFFDNWSSLVLDKTSPSKAFAKNTLAEVARFDVYSETVQNEVGLRRSDIIELLKRKFTEEGGLSERITELTSLEKVKLHIDDDSFSIYTAEDMMTAFAESFGIDESELEDLFLEVFNEEKRLDMNRLAEKQINAARKKAKFSYGFSPKKSDFKAIKKKNRLSRIHWMKELNKNRRANA